MTALRAFAVRLAIVEPWLTLPLLAAASLTARLAPAALIVAGLFWGVRWLAAGRLSRRTPADWAALALGLICLVTVWVTPLPEVTSGQVYRLLGGIGVFYVIVNWACDRRRLAHGSLGVVSAGLLLALSAPISVEWLVGVKLLFIPETLYRRLPLLLPDPIHPNVMAGALAVLLPIALAGWLYREPSARRGARILHGIAIVAMLAALALTKSRGGLMALAASLLVLIVLRWRRGWIALPAFAAVTGLMIWRISLPRLFDLLATTKSIGGLAGRLEVWSRALYMLHDFPLTGIGMGAFQQVTRAIYPLAQLPPDAEIPHAHNLFLQIAVDLGLPGLIAWLSLLLIVVWAAWQIFRQGRRVGDRWLTGLGAGLLSSQAALVIHGFTDAVTWGTRPALIIWAIWGLAMAGHAIRGICTADEIRV